MVTFPNDLVVSIAFVDCDSGDYDPPPFQGKSKDLYDLAWMIYDEYMEGVMK